MSPKGESTLFAISSKPNQLAFPPRLYNKVSLKILMKESLLGRCGIIHLDQAGGSAAALSTPEGTSRSLCVSKDLRSQHVVYLHTRNFFANGLVEIALKIREDCFGDTAKHGAVLRWL